MSWTPRASASSLDSINTYDSTAPTAGSYNVQASLGCSGDMIARIAAIKGAGLLVQANSSSSAAGSFTNVSLAFTNPNAAGNCLIVTVFFNGSFPGNTATCLDSNLNAYVQQPAGHLGGNYEFTFIALRSASGANTVTVTFAGLGVPGGGVAIAISEYVGGSFVDNSFNQGLINAGALNFNITTTAPNELLYLALVIGPACPGSPSGVIGGGPGPPIPPAVTGGIPTPTQPFFANLPPPPLTTPIVDVYAEQRGVPFPLRGVPTGDLANAWSGWFSAVYQFLESSGLAGAAGSLGATTITTSTALPGPGTLNPYTGQIIALNAATPQTLTLSSPPPNGTWNVFIENIGSAPWTLNPNGLLIDGSSASLILTTNSGVYLSTDGVNYFTERGIAQAGSSAPSTAQFAWDETPGGTINGSNATFTLASAPNPAASLQLFQNGILAIQGTDYTLSGATITMTGAPSTGAILTAFYRFGSPPGVFVDDEIPHGAVDGSNIAFTLANIPVPATSLKLFDNGVLQIQGTDYTISGLTITFANAPNVGDELIAYYVYSVAATNFADNETPSGTVNGTNPAFGLAHTPNPAGSLNLYVNGVLQLFGTDFTLATATITFSSAPSTGAILTAFYRY